MSDRVETNLVGFAFFGWAWPVCLIAVRVLLWIVTAVIFAGVFVFEATRWLRARISDRVR